MSVLIALFIIGLLAAGGLHCYNNPQWFVLLLIRICKLRTMDNFYFQMGCICERENYGDVAKIMESRKGINVTEAAIKDSIPLYAIEGPSATHLHTLLLLANECEAVQCEQHKALRMFSNGFAIQDDNVKECVNFVNSLGNEGVEDSVTLKDIVRIVAKLFRGNDEINLAELFIIDRHKHATLETLRVLTRKVSGTKK